MKLSFFSCLALAGLLLFSSCGKEDVADFSDAELIEAIQKANKQAISKTDLPTLSLEILEEEYTESDVNNTLKAEGLGYEVETRRKSGSQIGEKGQVYFNLKGKKLSKHKKCDKRKEDCDKDWDKEDCKDRKECFKLVFPVTMTMSDGSSITGADEDELWTNMKAWYTANPTADKEKPMLQFPVDVKFTDGTILTVTDEAGLKAAYGRCPDRDEETVDRDCFKLTYPLTYTMPDGSIITGAEDRVLWTDIKNWYDTNPNVEAEPVLQYPVGAEFDDGSTMTINDDEDMRAAYETCKE